MRPGRNAGFVFVGMSGGMLLLVVLAAIAAGALLSMLWVSAREAESREGRDQPASTGVSSPWAETDAILGDGGARRQEDVRPEMARRGLAEAKDERSRLEAEERKLRAEVERRKREMSDLRAETAAAGLRLEQLRAEARADPTDEEAKNLLYETWVKLEGGEGAEGLKARSVRAEAELSEASARADGIRRRLRELDSGIVRAESDARRVEGAAGYGAAKEASRRGMAAVRTVGSVADSTERESTDAAAEAAGAKSRRDAVVRGLLEGR